MGFLQNWWVESIPELHFLLHHSPRNPIGPCYEMMDEDLQLISLQLTLKIFNVDIIVIEWGVWGQQDCLIQNIFSQYGSSSYSFPLWLRIWGEDHSPLGVFSLLSEVTFKLTFSFAWLLFSHPRMPSSSFSTSELHQTYLMCHLLQESFPKYFRTKSVNFFHKGPENILGFVG